MLKPLGVLVGSLGVLSAGLYLTTFTLMDYVLKTYGLEAFSTLVSWEYWTGVAFRGLLAVFLVYFFRRLKVRGENLAAVKFLLIVSVVFLVADLGFDRLEMFKLSSYDPNFDQAIEPSDMWMRHGHFAGRLIFSAGTLFISAFIFVLSIRLHSMVRVLGLSAGALGVAVALAMAARDAIYWWSAIGENHAALGFDFSIVTNYGFVAAMTFIGAFIVSLAWGVRNA